MIQRIQSEQNPNFFFLNYWDERFAVRDLMIVLKHFFSPNVIQKKKAFESRRSPGRMGGMQYLDSQYPRSGEDLSRSK